MPDALDLTIEFSILLHVVLVLLVAVIFYVWGHYNGARKERRKQLEKMTHTDL